MGVYAEHVQRMVTEEVELRERMMRLGAFIEGGVFSNLASADRQLLRIQLMAMSTYQTVLVARLVRAGVNPTA